MREADRDATRKALSKPAAFVVLSKGLALKNKLIDAGRLRQFLHYDPAAGHFTRLVASGTAARDSLAGWLDAHGYWMIAIDGRKYRAHRLAVLFMTGEWPAADVDHANGLRADNRWANLRQASRSENNQNKAIDPRNSSGFAGVTWDADRGAWRAQIKHQRRNRFIGRFSSPSDAHAAYLAAKRALHIFHPTVRDAAQGAKA